MSAQIISVPIMRPKVHSNMCSVMPNQVESMIEVLRMFRACGPMTIPVMSQPRMAGSLAFETSFPAKYAMTIEMARSSRSTSRFMMKNSP